MIARGIRRRTSPLRVLFVLLLFPFPARAHLASSGLGPFYDGALHLWLSAEQGLSVVAVTLLAGLGGPRHGRAALMVLPAAWSIGGAVALGAPTPAAAAYTPALALLLIGLLVALDLPGPAAVTGGLAALVGGVNGYLGGLDAAAGGIGWAGLAGTVVTVFVTVVLLSAAWVVLTRQAGWTRTVLRVAGSWLAAVGLLMSGWMIRQGG